MNLQKMLDLGFSETSQNFSSFRQLSNGKNSKINVYKLGKVKQALLDEKSLHHSFITFPKY
jgi:hypothetical protein